MLASAGRWTLPNAMTGCIVLLLVIWCFGPFTDLDYTWQIRTGEQIVQVGELRTVDSFSYTIAGQRVPDFEWLYEVVLYLIWISLGCGGLKVLKLVLIVAPLLLVARHLHRQAVSRSGVVAALAVAVLILLPMWNLRALYCTTIGLLLIVGWLHEHCAGQQRLPWLLPVVMLLWANLHPGVIAGQGLLAGAIVGEWLNVWIRWNRPLERSALWRLTLLGGLGLLATFVSPDPIDRLWYPFRPELHHPIMRIFTEMQPLASFWSTVPLTVGLTYVVAALTLLTVCLRGRHYRGWELALLAMLTLLGNLAARGLQDWLLVMLALGTPQLLALLPSAAQQPRLAGFGRWWTGRIEPVFRGPLLRQQPCWLAVGSGTVIAAALLLSPAEPTAATLCEMPSGVADYIEQHHLRGRFFASPSFGAYLGWRLGEEAQVYVDTRGFFFPPILLEDSCHVPQMLPGWERRLPRILQQYDTDYVLLETTGVRGQLWQHLRQQVQPLCQDETAVLLTAAQLEQAVQHWTAEQVASCSEKPAASAP